MQRALIPDSKRHLQCPTLPRTLACLADAHDEAFLLTRLADEEDLQPADFHAAVQRKLGSCGFFGTPTRFTDNIKCMFERGGIWDTPGSYTRYILDGLGSKPLMLIFRGKPVTIGGPASVTTEMKDTILARPLALSHPSQPDRMRNWCILAGKIIETEFPSFGIMKNLSLATGLGVQTKRGARMPPANIAACRAVSKLWGLDTATWLIPFLSELPSLQERLLLEMQALFPVAQNFLKRGHDEGTAWREALMRERKLCGAQSCAEAAKLVCRRLALTFSTSNVERL